MSLVARRAMVSRKAGHKERALGGPSRPPPTSAAPPYSKIEKLKMIRHGASPSP